MRSRRKTTHGTAREEGSRGAAACENPRCASIPRKSGSPQVAGRSRDLSLSGGCGYACGPLNGQSPHFAMADTRGTRRFQCRISPNTLDGLKRCLPSRNHPIPILHRRNSGLHQTGRFLQVISGGSKATPAGERCPTPRRCWCWGRAGRSRGSAHRLQSRLRSSSQSRGYLHKHGLPQLSPSPPISFAPRGWEFGWRVTDQRFQRQRATAKLPWL